MTIVGASVVRRSAMCGALLGALGCQLAAGCSGGSGVELAETLSIPMAGLMDVRCMRRE